MPKIHYVPHKKRHGLHHRQNHRYLKTYLPYLPLLVSIFMSLVLSSMQPATGKTLAYATNMSITGLLQSTNSQREGNGQADLSLNQQLNSAAQAKANDMVARNYWSHNTPDGQEPWVFFNNAGYKYTKAGENLAYGFNDSSGTITGWMNSPPHRENLLDSSFIEVGFGFANGSNYNNAGNETVVVAMYGRPQTLGASTQEAPPAVQTPAPQQTKATPKTLVAPTSESTPTPDNTPTPAAKASEIQIKPASSNFPIVTNDGLQSVSRVQALTNGEAPWSLFWIGIACGAATVLLLLKHALAIRHLFNRGERLLLRQLHHPLFDSVMIGLLILAFTLTRTVGFIA